MTKSQPPIEVDDDFDVMFPGSSLTHVLTIISHDRISVTIEALTTVQASGGSLDALRLVRMGDKLEHQLRLTGLRPGQARHLSNRLAEITAVECVRIEHQIVRMAKSQTVGVPWPD